MNPAGHREPRAARLDRNTLLSVCTLLAAVSVLATLLSLLALQDIWHGETNVTLEWNVVRVAYLILGAFYVAFFYTVRRFRRERKNSI